MALSRRRSGSTRRRSALPAALAATFASMLLLPAGAGAGPQGQRFHMAVLGCITGDSDVAARRGCRTVPGASQNATSSGLTGVVALTGGDDGKSLYAVGNTYAILTRLALGPAAGRIAFGSCFTGNTFVDDCTQVPGATANAFDAPVANPTNAAISPDGRSLYVTSGDFHGAVVAWFNRDPLTGELTYAGCLSGDTASGPGGSGACALIPNAVKDGYGSGLEEPSGVAVSSSGAHVYVTAALDQSVTVLARDPATGALSFTRCISSEPRVSGCIQVPGGDHVLDEVMSPLISADGRFLYTVARRAGTIDTFALDGAGGITYLRCLSAQSLDICGRGNRLPGGPYTLQSPYGLTETPDRRFVYAVSSGSIVVLRRSPRSGRLSPASCISGYSGDRGKCTQVPNSKRLAGGSPLYGGHTPILSRNGKIMYLAVRGEDGVTGLHRNPRTGALSFIGCVTGNIRLSTARKGVCAKLPGATRDGEGSGFLKTGVLAQGPGSLLYAAAPRDSTISVLRP